MISRPWPGPGVREVWGISAIERRDELERQAASAGDLIDQLQQISQREHGRS